MLKEYYTGDYYEPQTTAGEYARTVGEFLPGAIVPGGLATKAASVLVPAIASETAGQMTEGTPMEQPARIGAGIVGGLGVGAASALRGGANVALGRAARGVTPEQMAMAEALRARSPIPLTQAEAIQQVTGGATNMGRLQSVVERSSNELGPMMAQRPEAVRQAVSAVTEQIAPPMAPQAVAGRAQQASEGVIDRMRQRVNASAADDYRAAEGQVVSAEEYSALRSMPSYRLAEEALFANPILRPGTGPQSVDAVKRVIRQMDTMEAAASPSLFNPAADATLSSAIGQEAGLARGVSNLASPELARARQTVATGREAFVDPLKRGPLGAIASQQELRPTVQGQIGALFPQTMNEGQAAETVQALRLMGEIDPSAPAPLVRQYLATQANQSLRDVQSGANQFGGASLAARIAGTPENAAAFFGSVDAAAPMAARDARGLVEALRATGQRMRPGSETAFNTEILKDISGGGALGEGARAVASPLGIPSRISNALTDFLAERNSREIARALMAPPEEATRRMSNALRSRRGGNRIRIGVAGTQNGED
jgi:hypothetical protein